MRPSSDQSGSTPQGLTTRISVHAAQPRARVALVGGLIAPRLIARTPQGARVALVAAGALLLPGDHVQIDVEIGDDAHLELSNVGGTVCYGEPATRQGRRATWQVTARLGERATLGWAGLPLVIADGAHVHRETTVELGRGATALLRETSVLGRTGEAGGVLRARLRAGTPDGPLLVEDLRVDGAHPEDGVLGANRVYDTVTALGYRPDAPSGADVLALDGPGVVARFLGSETHRSNLAALFDDFDAQRGTTHAGTVPATGPAQ